MKEKDLKELTAAFDVVFNDEGEIKACGRSACMELISLMKKNNSSNDVGDEKTGNINSEIMKNEYLRILRVHIRG